MKRGFTLIEMMVALGLVMVIVGLAVPSFLRNNRVQKVTALRDKLKMTYIQARDNALSGKNECGNLAFQGWRVVKNNSQVVRVEGVCSQTNTTYPDETSTFPATPLQYTVPTGLTVTITNLTNGPTKGVLFRSGGQGIYPHLTPAQSILVTVSNGIAAENKTFTINGFGRIQ
jgi:prepilin-type N-terminal cleavage/methylation domain-containing protein